MIDYLIRTNKKERITNIVKIGQPNQNIAIIYTDFELYKGIRDITIEDIVGQKQKTMAKITVLNNGDIFNVSKNGLLSSSVLSSLTDAQEYFIGKEKIPYSIISKAEIMQKEEYKNFKDSGVVRAYFPDDKSDISKILCYEKDGELSGIVTSNKDDSDIPLMALPLVFSKRIEDQKYLFEFMRKVK